MLKEIVIIKCLSLGYLHWRFMFSNLIFLLDYIRITAAKKNSHCKMLHNL